MECDSTAPGESRAVFGQERNRNGKEQENPDRPQRAGPRASREDQDRSPFDPQACAEGGHHPSPRRRPHPVADDEGHRHVEADGLALAGPLPRGGCRRPASRHPAETGPQADFRGQGQRTDRAGDVAAAGARRPLDAAGAGDEAGDRRLDGVRHPEEPWPQAPQGQDVQGLPRPGVRAEGPRCRRSLRQSARPRCRHPGGREDADPGAGADAEAPADEARPSPRPARTATSATARPA